MSEWTVQRRWGWFVLVVVVAVAAVPGLRLVTGAGSGDATTASDAGAPLATGSADAQASGRQDAPDVRLTLLDGSEARLADVAGRPLVLNFWASWCPPCVAEMGDALEPAHQRYGAEVAFLGVNLQDEPDAAQRIVDQTGVTYDLAVDPDGSVFRAFQGVGMPTTVFIDAQGRVVDRHTGIITAGQLAAQIARLLTS